MDTPKDELWPLCRGKKNLYRDLSSKRQTVNAQSILLKWPANQLSKIVEENIEPSRMKRNHCVVVKKRCSGYMELSSKCEESSKNKKKVILLKGIAQKYIIF